MVERIRLTDARARAVPRPARGQLFVRDAVLVGFGLRVTDEDARSWIVEARVSGGPTRRVKLDSIDRLTVAEARAKGRRLLADMSAGIDPVAVRKAQAATGTGDAAVTLQMLWVSYQKSHRLRSRTVTGYAALLHRHLADWLDLPVVTIDARMVLDRHQAIPRRSQADAAMRVLRAVLRHGRATLRDAGQRPLLGEPATEILTAARQWSPPRRRRRVIKPGELAAWWQAVASLRRDTPRDLLHFLILTGCRQSEATGLRWADVDLAEGSFVLRETKNGEPHELPLGPWLWARLRQRREQHPDDAHVFQHGDRALGSARAAARRVGALSGVLVAHHDLRRTFASAAEALDISGYALKRLLNHRAQRDVTGGYVVHDLERLRDAMEKVERQLLQRAGVGGGEVVPFRRVAS